MLGLQKKKDEHLVLKVLTNRNVGLSEEAVDPLRRHSNVLWPGVPARLLLDPLLP